MLAPSRRALVASPDHVEKQGRPFSVEDLPGHRGVFYTNRAVRLQTGSGQSMRATCMTALDLVVEMYRGG
jgi:hypothetical protein